MYMNKDIIQYVRINYFIDIEAKNLIAILADTPIKENLGSNPLSHLISVNRKPIDFANIIESEAYLAKLDNTLKTNQEC